MGVLTQSGLTEAYNKAYDACVESYFQGGKNPNGWTLKQCQDMVDASVLTQSYLRLEILLTATANSYQLQILDNQQNNGVAVRPTEKRLAQQDSFFVNSLAIYIGKAASATDTAFIPMTYPNSVTFATGGASPAPLATLYNGYFDIKINKEIIVAGLPVLEYLQIPQTQLTAATNSPVTEFDPAQVGILQPNINFVGTKQTTFNFTLPANISAVDAFTYLIVECKGVLAQNITLMS